MSDCEEKIYSNDYVDFIISKDVLDVIDLSSDCIQRIDEEKDTYFYPRSFFRIFDFPADSYASVPKCYGLLDETALEVSGILKLQQQPALALKGQGVMIGFIDTGIDYRNPVFQYSDGTTRIYRIWIRQSGMEQSRRGSHMVPSIRQSRSMPHSGQKIRWKPFRPWIPMDMEPLWPGWHVEARMWKIILSGRRRFPRSQS